jgi:hypothetical protein
MNYLFISASLKNNNASKDSFFSLFQDGLYTEFNTETINLSGDVEFMIKRDEQFIFDKKPIQSEIRITKMLVNTSPLLKSEENHRTAKTYLLNRIIDYPKKEIISATKVSMFSQCPVKYELTYELGFPTIFNVIKRFSNEKYDFNDKEDEELKSYASVKGRIVHEVLKENPGVEEIDKLVENLLSAEKMFERESTGKLKENIIIELTGFCSSQFYKSLTQYKEFYNEYEIYAEEGENYLYGIVDKFVIEKDKLIIIDYKTDDIGLKELDKRAADYFQQLTFYAYVLSKYFKSYDKYELLLVFTKYPDSVVTKSITTGDLSKFKEQLNLAINNIQNRIFLPNYNHCSSCHFTIKENKCIKPL